jgi:hypothetical protein
MAASLFVIGAGVLGAVIGLLILAGTLSPLSSNELLGFDPERAAARHAASEAADEEQLLALENRRRSREGLPDLAYADLEAQVHRDLGDPRFPPGT